jgi:hypothetical protein
MERDTETETLIETVSERPYSPLCRMKLASRYSWLKYPDLASGEAYIALLLCDEIFEETAEFHEHVTEASREDMNFHKTQDKPVVSAPDTEAGSTDDEGNLSNWVKRNIEHWA